MASNGMLSRYQKKKAPPAGWEEVQQVMDALEEEMKNAVAAPTEGIESHRRYIFDMFYKYERIDRKILNFCVKQKLVDANLMAKWKKSGYERLCCTHAINPRNHNFGTVSVCRVPKQQLEAGRIVVDVTCGCLGCASGKAGFRNIFGNKYGQYLADVQAAREQRAQNAAQLAATRVEAMATAADASDVDPAAAGDEAAPDSGDLVVDQAVGEATSSYWEEGDADAAAEEAADAVLGHFATVWAEEGEMDEEDSAHVLARTGQGIEVSASADDMAALRAAMGGMSGDAAASGEGGGAQSELDAVQPSGKKARTE